MTILNHNLDHQHQNIALQVRQMRDLHIEALVRQYGGEEGKELADCPVVKEYRCNIGICICFSKR